MSIPDDADENIGENLQQADDQLDDDDRTSAQRSGSAEESRPATDD